MPHCLELDSCCGPRRVTGRRLLEAGELVGQVQRRSRECSRRLLVAIVGRGRGVDIEAVVGVGGVNVDDVRRLWGLYEGRWMMLDLAAAEAAADREPRTAVRLLDVEVVVL